MRWRWFGQLSGKLLCSDPWWMYNLLIETVQLCDCIDQVSHLQPRLIFFPQRIYRFHCSIMFFSPIIIDWQLFQDQIFQNRLIKCSKKRQKVPGSVREMQLSLAQIWRTQPFWAFLPIPLSIACQSDMFRCFWHFF